MPELPEVETVRRGLSPHWKGAAFERVELRRADLRYPFPEGFARRLEGQTVTSLGRRAKYMLAHLAGGEVLVIHLGMTGRFTVAAAPDQAREAVHDHVIFTMRGGCTARFNDARRFGFMTLAGAGELDRHALFRELGVEPLGPGLTPAWLAQRARGRAQPLKGLLLDQRVIAGLGNIYVCEALHRARLDPRAPAAVLEAGGNPAPAAGRLVTAIRGVLNEAIAAGGSTLRDYAQPGGSPGYFQHDFAVYGRTGEPCRRRGCGGTIARAAQSGRSTFYCPVCQNGVPH